MKINADINHGQRVSVLGGPIGKLRNERALDGFMNWLCPHAAIHAPFR